ncbi:putative cupin domain-containing protein [Erysiphe neolycopersici]|uniref:Putative cupin domain-containing protein n=1 Tax=Erysiphe neolycopersici TaxID=212602 RepID=A0A420HNY3_9PEZI|nr:putative cupin domain-containing protein [Erysiphe neolycopersici]
MTAKKFYGTVKTPRDDTNTEIVTKVHQRSTEERRVTFVCTDDKNLEIIKVGPATIQILEDGSHTDDRFGAVSVTLAPNTPGPIPMWHRMNDTTFYITKGRLRFFTSSSAPSASTEISQTLKSENKPFRILKAGDYIVVPPCAIHNFDNPFQEEAAFLNTFTPAYYVDAIRTIAKKTQKAVDEGRFPLDPEEQLEIMRRWATFPPPVN